MEGQSSRHQAVLEELIEWLEDIGEGVINSRVVMLEVPPGWGATSVLREFATTVDDPDGRVAISVGLDEVLLAGRATDAKALSDALLAPLGRSRLAELLKPFGLDTSAGRIGLALGMGGLFVSGVAVQLSLLLAPYAVNAAQYAWDAGPAGQQGVLARAARMVAAVSADLPVAVMIDDADRFDPDLATVMIENLASRLDGQVLVVVAVHPGSALVAALKDPGRYGLSGRVVRADADPDISVAARTALARELRPGLPDSAAERIGHRTASFAEVFTVAGEKRLADLTGTDRPAAVPTVDAVIDAALTRSLPSAQTRVLAWAAGALTVGQVDQALAILGERADAANDPDVIRAGGLARLRDPVSAHIQAQAGLLSAADRHALAVAVLGEAGRLASDSEATLVERTTARLAAHRVRADLDSCKDLTQVQCLLVRGLEQLGDPEAAYQIAVTALAELPRDDRSAAQRADLLKAWLRLARTRSPRPDDPLIEEAIELATSSGALPGIESRVWAAVSLLRRSGPRGVALALVNQLTVELGTLAARDPAASQWRLLLAFHAGYAGYAATAQQLLAPLVRGGTQEQQNAAQAVLRAFEGPRADVRLQIIILEAELEATMETADDDRLRINHALAMNYSMLGNYQQALHYGSEELHYRLRLQSSDNPTVLLARYYVAYWTDQYGDARTALRLSQDLLPDLVRVLGPDHPDTLATRGLIANTTGRCGDIKTAMRLYRDVLSDMARVLGTNHPNVLAIRSNVAYWTGQSGDARGALQLFQELLPDRLRIQGPDHPDVLTTRSNAAFWTGESGDARGALQLFQELLPDRLRIQGPDHPDVLSARANIAFWTGRAGDARGALQLFQELLPDRLRIQGPNHPEVFTTQSNIASLTGQCGNAEDAVRLYKAVLPDIVRALGPDHPLVRGTRVNISFWTARSHDR